jgi:hypothetical protein
MAKASMKLPDGTTIEIDGSAEEIQKIIALHKPAQPEKPSGKGKTPKRKTQKEKSSKSDSVDISAIVNEIKNCEDAEAIEENILDRTSQVDRILLPLYIAENYLEDKPKLTTGEISKVLGDLSINIFTPNVANTLSGAASKYVIGDKVRKKGQPVRYKLSRRGQQYLASVIENKAD